MRLLQLCQSKYCHLTPLQLAKLTGLTMESCIPPRPVVQSSDCVRWGQVLPSSPAPFKPDGQDSVFVPNWGKTRSTSFHRSNQPSQTSSVPQKRFRQQNHWISPRRDRGLWVRCPKCDLSFHFTQLGAFDLYERCGPDRQPKVEPGTSFYRVQGGECPECNERFVLLNRCRLLTSNSSTSESVDVLFPPPTVRKLAQEIPKNLQLDFQEASLVLVFSPKASAALSRRILQAVLREHFHIRRKTLYDEIEVYITQNQPPSRLADHLHALREIGNNAAHPLKETNTGQIVDVEMAEAAWMLDLIEDIFDHAFVTPARNKSRKAQLNATLTKLGKKPVS